ncbi:nucleotidyl transferase AbiEii/AbiGii toxin family protein [Treponema sp. R6D11]
MGKKQLPEEFKEFVQYLNKNKIKYLLVGGWAVGIYGHPRATKDIDFLFSNDQKNLNQIKKALDEFGAPPIDLEKFKEDGYVIRIGSSPIQIDMINSADGIDINDCFKRKKILDIDGVKINVIAIDDLIINKKTSARNIDIADADKLEKQRNIKK